jgi:hypothetical protein
MFSPAPRTIGNVPKALWLIAALVFVLVLVVLLPPPTRPFISRWNTTASRQYIVPIVLSPAATQPTVAPIVARAVAVPPAPERSDQASVVMEANYAKAAVEPTTLDRYNQGSVLQEAANDGLVSFYRRDLAGGSIAYFVVMLKQQVHIEVINADGATPGSDSTGDTIWTDGQKHLATVAEMAQAPYAAREGMQLLGAMAFGFHGDLRTSDEGTVVINGTIHRVNPGRATLCITSDGQATIGLFDANALQACQQAIGAGPVILWHGKIANPDVGAETHEFLPFNPLGEDFVQLDWRRMIYSGSYPKTVIGVGRRPDGGSYLVMLTSDGVGGVDLAGQLKAMGCTEAIGGDDDTSTQAVWGGAPVQARSPRAVPDALAVYLRR